MCKYSILCLREVIHFFRISGTFPASLPSLVRLKDFLVNDMRLSGSIPNVNKAMGLTRRSSFQRSAGNPWELVNGSCIMTDATCLTSPGYPIQYSNAESCTIRMLKTGYISSSGVFSTEWDFDILYIAAEGFSGTLGPEWIYVTQEDMIYWSSDLGMTSVGWKICFEPDLPDPAASEVQTFSVARNLLTGDTMGIDNFISLQTVIVAAKYSSLQSHTVLTACVSAIFPAILCTSMVQQILLLANFTTQSC